MSAIQSVLYGLAPSTCAANFLDIVSGPNGTCGTLFTTAVGYDYVTNLRRPMAADLIQLLISGFRCGYICCPNKSAGS
ncbi:hypothetical protein [Burkholderia diffusa]|uniref:hypothetical protein n=1 Tax=Burkholderia diffusa TaxID=488732 RepID=UPI000755C4A4|nr:hypothetical protein [Burkholderia diffusa]KVN00014.1 hypothetical protein WJ62_16065 [Burkholderia diffusa]